MAVDSSFGIIPLQKIDHVWHVLLIQQYQGFWTFPKGHREKNEEPLESAIRELKEETGLDIDKMLREAPIIERYSFFHPVSGVKIDKTVYYFLSLVSGVLKLQQEEIIQAKWMRLEEAFEQITYQEAKATCKEVMEILSKIEQ